MNFATARNLTAAFFVLLAFGAISLMVLGDAKFPQWLEVILGGPLPILRTKKALTDMQSGQVLKVLATDPGAVKDFQAFSRQTGHELVSHAEADKEFTFFMRKK